MSDKKDILDNVDDLYKNMILHYMTGDPIKDMQILKSLNKEFREWMSDQNEREKDMV